MDRIWLKHYRRAFRPRSSTASTARSETVERIPLNTRDRPAYTNMGRTISFGELERLSRAFGAWLQGRGSQGARGSR